MAIFFKPSHASQNGFFHGRRETGDSPPWIMVPGDSHGMEVILEGGDEVVPEKPNVVRIESVAGTPKGRKLVKPISPGTTTIYAREAGRNVIDGGREVKLDVAVLLKREFRVTFIVPNLNLSKGGSFASNRGLISVREMMREANDKIMQPQTNVTIVVPYPIKQIEMEVSLELQNYIKRGVRIDCTQPAVRDAFCKLRDPAAHFTVICVPLLEDPEIMFRTEQFCLIEDGISAVTKDLISYGAYGLAHATGHMLLSKAGAESHSKTIGDLMYHVIEQGGLRISRNDAVKMNEGAGKMTPPTSKC